MPESGVTTVTKKELVNRIAEETGQTKVVVKHILQRFLDNIIDELEKGNRLEFREFGVFEVRMRASRQAQNPRTLEKVTVPAKRVVRFKVGRTMRERVGGDDAPELPKRIMPKAPPAPPETPEAPPTSNSPF
ncbi:MAG: integration host factor subunit beta [Planctomycetota bacterium]|jgi:integration host factor subunit beta